MKGFLVRFILALGIIEIALWLISSSQQVFSLQGITGGSAATGGELPEWLRNFPPLARVIFYNLTANIWFSIIGIGLLIEFISPRINFAWNKNRYLTFLSIILIGDGVISMVFNGFFSKLFSGTFTNFGDYLYDTVIYGPLFGTLFLLQINPDSKGLRIVFWAYILEFFGFFLGFLYIPARIFGVWTGGPDYLHAPLPILLTDFYFWTDFTVQIIGTLGIIYIILKSGIKPLRLALVGTGALLLGLTVAFITTHL